MSSFFSGPLEDDDLLQTDEVHATKQLFSLLSDCTGKTPISIYTSFLGESLDIRREIVPTAFYF